MDPVNPQDDPALIAKLAAMTDDEFAAVVNRARGEGRETLNFIAALNNRIGRRSAPTED